MEFRLNKDTCRWALKDLGGGAVLLTFYYILIQFLHIEGICMNIYIVIVKEQLFSKDL